MPFIDKFDICQAYYQIEADYHQDGWLKDRPSNQLRLESTDVQLHRIGFSVGMGWNGYESLSENGKDIYHLLRKRYGFDKWDCWEQINGVEARLGSRKTI